MAALGALCAIARFHQVAADPATLAHRLSAVRHASRIIVMDKGRIVEAGAHEALVGKPEGLYAHLWRMQDGAGTDSKAAK